MDQQDWKDTTEKKVQWQLLYSSKWQLSALKQLQAASKLLQYFVLGETTGSYCTNWECQKHRKVIDIPQPAMGRKPVKQLSC